MWTENEVKHSEQMLALNKTAMAPVTRELRVSEVRLGDMNRSQDYIDTETQKQSQRGINIRAQKDKVT